MKKFSFAKTGIYFLACIGVGCIFTTGFAAVSGGDQGMVRIYAIWMAASVLYGAASCIYSDKISMPLLLKTAIHCILCFAITVLASKLAFPVDAAVFSELLKSVTGTFLIIYSVIYIICYLNARKQAKDLNETMKRR